MWPAAGRPHFRVCRCASVSSPIFTNRRSASGILTGGLCLAPHFAAALTSSVDIQSILGSVPTRGRPGPLRLVACFRLEGIYFQYRLLTTQLGYAISVIASQ